MDELKVDRKVRARIPTAEGEFQLYLYHSNQDNKEHLALVMGDVEGKESVLVRVHSECFTGDVLGSRRCDCGEQLTHALQMIAVLAAGSGIGLLDNCAHNLRTRFDTQ
jgi:3,4-dihydroxy 2-butanone 4-phosphate synthase/GTP cyclohydrolase II